MFEIHGNTDGIKKTDIAKLQALYLMELDGTEFLPDELADRVAKVIWDNWQQQGVGGRPRNPENRPIYEEF